MFERLGKRIYVVPIVAVLIIACLLALLFLPIAKMDPRDLPFAIVSEDEGVMTPAGEVMLGDAVVEKLVTAQAENGDNAPVIQWTELDSGTNVEDALKEGSYFGALVIPKDFSAKMLAARAAGAQTGASTSAIAGVTGSQAASANQSAGTSTDALSSLSANASAVGGASNIPSAAAQGSAELPALTFYIDNAKSPLVVNMIQSMITPLMEQSGLTVDVVQLYPQEEQSSPASGLLTMMSQQFMLLPLVIMTIVVSALIYLALRMTKKTNKVQALLVSICLSVVVALVIALLEMAIASWIFALDMDYGAFFLYMWMASLFLVLLVLGCLSIHPVLGVIMILGILMGMMCGMLPSQVLPGFWADFIYPWAPQHYLGEGIRGILIAGQGAWPNGMNALSIMGGVGLALLIIGCLMPSRKSSGQGSIAEAANA